MLGSSNLIAFVGTANPARAKQFYENVLGLAFMADEPHALVFQSNERMIRLFKTNAFTPPPHTALGWVVDDIASTVDSLRTHGVSFERVNNLPQDDTGVWTSPDGAKVAWFKDPDGNVLSVTQFAKAA